MNNLPVGHGTMMANTQTPPNYLNCFEQFRWHSVAIVLAVFFLVGSSQSILAQTCAGSLPVAVIKAGYCTNTLNSRFNTTTVDVSGTPRSGFEWYTQRFAGLGGGTGSIILRGDQSVSAGGMNGGVNTDLATAAPSGTSWVGTAYGGGGYFEATLAFNKEQVVNADLNKDRWPSWWADPLETVVPLYNLWYWTPGNPQYLHSGETDFFEYDQWASDRGNNPDPSGLTWGGTVHDWTHVADSKSPWGYSVPSGGDVHQANNSDQAPAGTDLTKYHRYGLLWIPATQGNCNNTVRWNADGSLNLSSGNGVAVFFFDGVPFKTSSQYAWCKYNYTDDTPQAMLANGLANNWTFGILDNQHLVLTFGSGGAAPMQVYAVSVWQKDASGNVSNGQTVKR